MVNSQSDTAFDSASLAQTYSAHGERLGKLIVVATAALDNVPVTAEAPIQQLAELLACMTVEVAQPHAIRIGALKRMSAWIAHEVNQPVAAAVTNAQAALRFLKGPQPNLGEVRQALIRIARLGSRIVEVMGRTRALVQRVPPRKDHLQINEAIQEIVFLSQEKLVDNAVSVSTRFAQGLPFLQADRIQLQQVIGNLITNAVEAMSKTCERSRELRISTGQVDGGDILVAIQDSGPGLCAQNSDRIFDDFYSTKPHGLGIGLSICRSIIEAHEGRLWASPPDPRGATFQFTLPVYSARATAARHRQII